MTPTILSFLYCLGIALAMIEATGTEPPDDKGGEEDLSPRRAPQVIPEDDPYLPTSDFLPGGLQPDPIHRLDTVRSVWWDDLPARLVDRLSADSAAQRVIFRDTLTGADVWLICRSPGDEFEGFYSSLHNFNANGSMLEIDRFLMDVTGARPRPLGGLISRDRDRSSIRRFQWDPDDPEIGLCQRFSGAIHQFNIRTGEEAPLFSPGGRFPPDCRILLASHGRFMLVARQKNRADPFIFLADGRGRFIRRIELESRSRDPGKDHMGGLHLYQDQDENYFIIYSLNKAAARTTNPHQRWLAAMDGSIHLDADTLEGSLADGYLIDGKRHLLSPAGYDPMSSAIGHAGRSPSEQWQVDSDGAFIMLTDLRTHDQKRLAHVPSADHFDWSAPVDWFLHRTRRQPGLPIYRIEVPSGVVHRIVATNTDDHLSCFSYSHPSPDGTKCLFRSSMLGTLDMYLAVVRHPEPPREVKCHQRNGEVHLSWEEPEPGSEVEGYRIYRGSRSGGPYEPVTPELVTGKTFVDRPAARAACYVVTSVEFSGLESRRFSNEARLAAAGPINLYIEAETAGETFPMREVFVPPAASAGYAITRAVRDPLWETARGSALANWEVSLPREDDYWLWVRIRSRDGDEVAIDFAVDEDPVGRLGTAQPEWRWTRLESSLHLASGSHRLTGSMDVAGCELDKLLLTSDATHRPRGWGNLPERPPATPGELEAEEDETGRHIVLHWSHRTGPLHHHFNVYRSGSPGFEPSQRSLLGSPTGTTFIDPQPAGSGPLYYRVVAVDTWDNGSSPSKVAALKRTTPPEISRLRMELDETHLRGNLSLNRSAADATDRRWVVLDPSTGDGSIEIPLSVPAGRYLLWIRARSKGRYQTARLEIKGPRRAEKCIVIGAEEKLFGDPIWAWRRVQSLDSSTVPRRKPTWITVGEDRRVLTIRPIDGYLDIDEVFLTTSVHDFPDPAARRFSPTNAFRFGRIGP